MNDTKRVSKSSDFTCSVSFPAREGTWRAMKSTLTAMLVTQSICIRVLPQEDSQFPNLRSSAATYYLHANTAGAGQHRLIRSAPSRLTDVAVAQNDLRSTTIMRNRATGPVAHPASRSMTSPSPSVTVMIRPAADETTTRDGCVCWPKQARHTSQMDRLRMRGKGLAVVAAPARPSGREGVMASPPPPRRRWLLEGAGADFQHVLTASTVTYDQAEHCPIRLRV